MSTGSEPPRFDVFISYNRSDQPMVAALAVCLQDSGLSVWLDTAQMRAGTNWREQLERDMKRSAACIIVSGPSGYGRVQAQERGLAYVIRDERPDFRIVNVLLPGALGPGASLAAVDTWVRFHGSVDEPDALAALVAGIKGTEPQATMAATLPDDPAPYRGLSAFGTEDDRLFFGRRTEIEQLMSRLVSARFLAVIGNSGSGKTSIVQAGLIPAVRRNGIGDVQHWQPIVVQPGTAPLRSLALALAKAQTGIDPLVAAETRLALLSEQPGAVVDIVRALLNDAHGLLLVVDRLEEIFTIAETTSESERFVGALLRLAGERYVPTRVVVTLRADFYGRLDRHPGLATLVSDHQSFIQPLGADGAMEAIENPAACVGALFEKGLAAQLCSDATSQKRVMLPVLQLALDLLWIRRRRRWLTWDAYREMGRVDGALQYHADRAIAAIGGREDIARRLLCRLVWVGDNGQTSSRRCEKAALLDDDSTENAEVLQHLVNSRLIVISDDDAIPQAELIHDTLTTDWHWLQAAVHADQNFLQWRQILDSRRKEAAQGGEDTEPLLHGRSLEVAERWLMARRDDLSAAERQFIERSRALAVFDAERATWRSAVTSACGRWLGSNRSPQELFTGRRLEESIPWVRSLNTSVGAEEQAFITASVTLDLKQRFETIRAAQQKHRRQERRQEARKRHIYWLKVTRVALPYVAASLLVVAAASWAWVRSDRYQASAVLAQARGVIDNNSVITRVGARWIRVVAWGDPSLALSMARQKPSSRSYNPHSREAVYLLLEVADVAQDAARESLRDALAIVKAGHVHGEAYGNEDLEFQGDDVKLIKEAAERQRLDEIAREATTLFEEIWHHLRERVDFRMGLIYQDETPKLLAWAKDGRLKVDAVSLWDAAIATTVFRREEIEARAVALSHVFEAIPNGASLSPALAAIGQLDRPVYRRAALGGLLRGLVANDRLNDVLMTLEQAALDSLDEPDVFTLLQPPDPGHGALMSVFTALGRTRPDDAKRFAARLKQRRIAAREAIVIGIGRASRSAEARSEFEALRREHPDAELWDSSVAVARVLIDENRFDDALDFADQQPPLKAYLQIRALVAEALFKAQQFENAISLIPDPLDRYGLEAIAAGATAVTLEPDRLRLLQLVKDSVERAEPALDKAAAGRALSRMGAFRDARRLANTAPPDSPVRQVVAEEIAAQFYAKARSKQHAQN
jgi:hypothetical protein